MGSHNTVTSLISLDGELERRDGMVELATPLPEELEGRWVLERLLGKGGMGSVWLAYEPSLERLVAIKIVSAEVSGSAELLARFEREARLMAKLEHPNLVPVHAVGRHRGRPFLVMKHLEGETLSALFRRQGRLSPEALLPIAQQLCAGLQFIHDRGVVHRDVKPGNVFVSPEGHVTLLDLGIARGQMRDLTMTGMLIGTPKYMAPEQILARDYDGRADLYALCVALYELSTGAPLFDEDSDYSLMKAHIDQVPVDPTKLAPLSAPFAACLLKGLEKKPDRRFQSANELAAALERAVRAPSPPPPAPARPKSRSNKLPAPPPPTAWPVVAAVAIALAALGALAAVGIRHALREPVVVVESPTPPPPAPELPPAAHVDAPPVPEPAPLPPSPPPAPSVKPKRVVPKTGKGELRITTTASGELSWAYVDIDGVRQGATPLVLKLEPGKHLLAITRQGLPDQTREVDIAAEAVEKLVVEMTP